MRLRNIPGAKEAVAGSPLALDEKEALQYAGKWRSLFPEPNPIHLEVGMGRGRFIMTSSTEHPEINYLALEIREEMIYDALNRMEGEIPNLRFLWFNAELLSEVFAPGEVDRIFINFPDPWPKSRHAKRRLTALGFLDRYRQILADDGGVFFKTDNQDLFEWSVENFQAAGWQLQDVDRDLSPEKSGVITEYERRYRGKGQPIYFLHATK